MKTAYRVLSIHATQLNIRALENFAKPTIVVGIVPFALLHRNKQLSMEYKMIFLFLKECPEEQQDEFFPGWSTLDPIIFKASL